MEGWKGGDGRVDAMRGVTGRVVSVEGWKAQ